MLNDTQSQSGLPGRDPRGPLDGLICARCGQQIAGQPRVRVLTATYSADGYCMALDWLDYHRTSECSGRAFNELTRGASRP